VRVMPHYLPHQREEELNLTPGPPGRPSRTANATNTPIVDHVVVNERRDLGASRTGIRDRLTPAGFGTSSAYPDQA